MTSSLQLTEIRHGTIHAGIFRLSNQDISDLNVKPVEQDDYFLAVPSEHHLSKAKEVSIRALSGESMILLDRHLHPGITDEWRRIFCQEECVLNIVQEALSYHTSIALVSAGLGVSFVPKSSTFLKRKGVTFLKLRGKTPKPILYLCYQKVSMNPTLQNFINLVERARSNN
jgi:DNA-binding transcriptional LysR family regulator